MTPISRVRRRLLVAPAALALGATAGIAGLAGAASASSFHAYGPTPPGPVTPAVVANTSTGVTPSGVTSVSPSVTPTSTTSSGLAFTGADEVAVTFAGATAIGVGGLFVLSSRKRRHKSWA